MVKKKKRNFALTMFLLVILIFSSITSVVLLTYPMNNLSAATVTGYTSALSDLQVDDNFKKEDYPANSDDFETFKIIQIAESTGGELFIYTYQPSALAKQFELTTITLSQSIEDNAKFRLYELKLLDADGVFAKYKVKGIELKTDILRYYEITEIHRKFDSTFGDKQPTNGNTTTEIALNISQRWTAVTIDGKVNYNLVTLETLIVEAKYVGFIRYKNNSAPSWINKDSVDSHFVAFSIGNNDFDELVEAEVYYKSQLVETNSDLLTKDKYHAPVENYVSLKADSKVSIKENHTLVWNTNMYEYNEIQTVQEFFDSVNVDIIYEHGIFNRKEFTKLTQESREKIENMQYVLRFANTDYDHFESTGGAAIIKDTFTNIENVTILSLTFMKDGETIKLGVIDNKTNGSGIPDNITGFITSFADWFKYILIALAIIIVLVVLAPFLPIILNAIVLVIKAIGYAIWYVLKGIWWLASCVVAVFK